MHESIFVLLNVLIDTLYKSTELINVTLEHFTQSVCLFVKGISCAWFFSQTDCCLSREKQSPLEVPSDKLSPYQGNLPTC